MKNDFPIWKFTDKLDGWLIEYGAYHTSRILAKQTELGVTGSLMEIGVYWGKYLSILIDAQKENETVLGIDIFKSKSPTFVDNKLLEHFKEKTWKLLVSSSYDLGHTELAEQLETPARFVSIDGDHNFDVALHDIIIASRVIHEQGIIAVDDFMNPLAIPVTEAIIKFLSLNTDLVPFAFITNKLFLCKRPYKEYWGQFVLDVTMEDEVYQHSAHYKKHCLWQDRVATTLVGETFIILP